MTETQAAAIAQAVLEFLAKQKYQGEEILHAVICCDFVSNVHMQKALMPVIEKAFRDSESTA